VLFAESSHEPIARGDVTLTIRRWKRRQAKDGGRYRVGNVGAIEVETVEVVSMTAITAEDARRAGFANLAELQAMLGDDSTDTKLYRIAFHFVGPVVDPRAVLAAATDVPSEERDGLLQRLRRMDERSERPWVLETLRQIDRRPKVPARVLARSAGFDTLPFKANVRKLKGLGLTTSHEVGYELSPRGRTLWPAIEAALEGLRPA
jgi:hypothetical protein